MKKINVENLKQYLGRTIEEKFYLSSISLKRTSTDIPYLSFYLQDKTGGIWARIWEQNIHDKYLQYENCIVSIRGEVHLNSKQQLELVANLIEPVQVENTADYSNDLTEADINLYMELLDKYVDLVEYSPFKTLLNAFCTHYKQEFITSPSSLSHIGGNFNGGLLVQTICITNICYQLYHTFYNFSYPKRNSTKGDKQLELLLTGSLLANISCLKLFLPYPEARRRDDSMLIGKEVLTLTMIQQLIEEYNIEISCTDLAMLTHLINCSNRTVKPMTIEAQILQQAHFTYNSLSKLDYHLSINSNTGVVFDPKLNQYLYIEKGECNE